MAGEPTPSFSAQRRWTIFVSVVASMVAVVALVVMVNYLGARYYLRANWNSQMKIELSPLTLGLLKSVTNDVKVIVYYDRTDPLYGLVTAWLDEYRLANPKISVRTVDYLRDSVEAVKVKTAYKLVSADAKNLVIFDSGGRYQILDGRFLADVDYSAVANDTQPEFERKIKFIKAEEYFSGALLRLNNPKPLVAGFLAGHDEHALDAEAKEGYLQFRNVLLQKNIQTINVTLDGTNTLSADCNVLIIAGPLKKLPNDELEKIRQYLAQGGRLLVMFRWDSVYNHIKTGLEALLAEWGVDVGMNFISDPENTGHGEIMIVKDFNPNHLLVKPLVGEFNLGMLLPRSIGKLKSNRQTPEGLTVDELAFTGKAIKMNNDNLLTAGPKPLMVAVEKASANGVFNERGSTRIVAVGDSLFLDNEAIQVEENASFAMLAVSWLLEQNQLLQGISPHPVKDYKLMMTRSQMQSVLWIFLGVMPGAVLLFGGLVWVRRRH